jgi:hypothetical protein
VRRAIDDPDAATYPVVAMTIRGPLVAWSSRAPTGATVIRLSRD